MAVARANGTSHTYAQATGWRVAGSTTANAIDCGPKWTHAALTLDSGRTARGNFTLPTSEALLVIDCVAVIRLVLINVHTSNPHSTQVAKRSNPAPRMANTTE